METRRWINQSQPQTLVIAVFLAYFRAVFTLLFGVDDQIQVVFPMDQLLRVALAAALAGGAYGIANEKKWGYSLAVAAAFVPLVARLLLGLGIGLDGDVPAISPLEYDIIGRLFEVALMVLLLHPQSREYKRIWFK
ncbi:hypothetical protein BH18ACT4_BH18ACT4_02240 [soil metagenome]